MTLYDLLHSVKPEVLLANIRHNVTLNDVVFHLEEKYLPLILNALPGDDDNVPIYVIRDRQFKPIVAFDITLNAEITLSKILARQVLVSDPFKHLPPGIIAAHCYCALPVGIVVNPGSGCNVSQVFDQATKSIVTKVYDKILLY